MNREKQRDIIEAVGLVTIVASLVFLTLEVRQANLSSEIAAGNNVEATLREVALFVAGNREFAEVLEKGVNGDEVDSTDRFRLTIFYRTMLRGWQNTHSQFTSGVLDENVWLGQRKSYSRAVNNDQGLLAFWRSNRFVYRDEFNELIESMIAEAKRE